MRKLKLATSSQLDISLSLSGLEPHPLGSPFSYTHTSTNPSIAERSLFMASPTEPAHKKQARPISHLVHSTAANLLSLFASPKTTPSTPSTIRVAFLFPNSPKPLAFHSAQPDFKSAMKGVESSSESNSGFPSTVRIAGLNSNIKGGGPAFVGQVFSMCDLSGTGLMAVSTHFDIPFISKRCLI